MHRPPQNTAAARSVGNRLLAMGARTHAGATGLGSCLTDATRAGRARRTVRVLCRYVVARTGYATILAAFWPGGIMRTSVPERWPSNT